jgi:hypothetical protein
MAGIMLMSRISSILLAIMAFLVNSNDGFYLHGKSYGIEMKLFATKYLDHNETLLAVVVTVAAADSNLGRSCLWLGAVHIWRKWQMAVSTEI